jgi:hypothetical protein
VSAPHPVAADALLGLLLPFWQLVIGCCVLVVVVISVRRLGVRGASRMRRALVVTGAVVVGITALGLLIGDW